MKAIVAEHHPYSLPTKGDKMKTFVQRAEKTLRQNFLSI